MKRFFAFAVAASLACAWVAPVQAADNTPPPGFTALFNGKDLAGWKGLLKRPLDNPAKRAELTPQQLAEAQKEADEVMRSGWRVEDGALVFSGKGRSLCTAKDYGDFEMHVDWKIGPRGDSGIYLRGSPQVQIWENKIGSGGLYNNKINPHDPTKVADRPVGEWNTFDIKMVGDKVTVKLNGELVVDNVALENYWERDKPIYPTGQIELQNHGNTLWFKNIYLREIPRQDRLAWFHQAKFAMFIHWGLYALPAQGEWVMHRQKMPVAEYAKLAGQFNPVKFDADQWVRVAKDAGMRYMVITSKHHDGFAMFGSKASLFNIVDATPFKRDPLKELAEACRKQGIRLGFYYSHAQDWHHPGGSVSRGPWDPAQNGDFDNYLQTVAMPQIKELLTGYGPVAVLWCDTPWNMNRERGTRIVALLRAVQPATLINSRLMYHGRDIVGLSDANLAELREIGVDYLSYADRQIPAQPQWPDWETCMTLNRSWGYNAADDNWKSPDELIGHLAEVASKGGNYLLNVGPTAEGLIPEPSIKVLKEVGAWLAINGEAIYGAGPSAFGHEYGKLAELQPARGNDKPARRASPTFQDALDWRCTTRPGKLYIHLLRWPSAPLTLDGVRWPVTKVYLLADPDRKPLRYDYREGKVTVQLPTESPGRHITVLCLETKP